MADSSEASAPALDLPPPKPNLMMKVGCPECKNPDPDVVEGVLVYLR